MFHNHRVSVIIPALNEERALPKVLNEISPDIVDEVIVVDNGSSDKTAFAARQLGAAVVAEERRGYGAACLRGLATIKQTDIVVILDADCSNYPYQMEQLLIPIVDNEADFVLGSRVLGKREKGALAPQAYWGNKLSVFLIQLFFGYRYTDMGPFRAIRFESLKSLRMADKDFGWNAEMQIKAIRSGLRIKEVPTDYRRQIGRSKISGTLSGTVMAGTKIISTIVKYAFVKNGKK